MEAVSKLLDIYLYLNNSVMSSLFEVCYRNFRILNPLALHLVFAYKNKQNPKKYFAEQLKIPSKYMFSLLHK